MTEIAESSSRQLLDILDVINGTEDIIKCRRMAFTTCTKTVTHAVECTRIYVLGSTCDGLRIDGSDADLMSVHKRLQVIDTLCSCSDELEKTQSQIYLQTCYSASSAYVFVEMHMQLRKMLPINQRVIGALCDSAIHYGGKLLVGSSSFVEQYSGGEHVSGPSVMNSLPYDIDNDNVQAFHCKTFPFIAGEWIHRKRNYSWPSSRVISLSKELGYHLVPIGDYNTSMHQFKWRISFALQECLLVRTFSHLQMQVYALMKIIKSEVLSAYKSQHTEEPLITSYHIKTLMFWIIECTPRTMWCETYLFRCIRVCLVFLKHFVKSNFLPHYFLPQCNLFKKHVSRSLSDVLNKLLSGYSKNPLSVIRRITHVMDILPFWLGDAHSIRLRVQLLDKDQTLTSYSQLCCTDINDCYHPMTVLQVLLTNDQRSNDCEWHITYGLLLNSILNYNQQIKAEGGVKSIYKYYSRIKQISLLYTHLNISTGWLLLSSYLYQIHNYDKSCDLINRKVILPITEFPQKIYCGKVRNNPGLMFIFTLMNECRGLSFSQQCKHLVCCMFNLHHSLIPCELNFESYMLLENEINSLWFLPLPYAYFLAFLCSYHIHDVQIQSKYLDHLQSMLTNKHFGFRRRAKPQQIILNMLGICYELMGDVSKAAYYYALSAYEISEPTTQSAAKARLCLSKPDFVNYLNWKRSSRKKC